ncbi:MAG: PEP-CTERM sorting domain-containing protein [Patescibacteria group bacterium]
MKKSMLLSLVVCGLVISSAVPASAATVYDDTQVAIYGGGNPNTGWVTSFNPNLNLNLSLRAKDRSDGSTPNNGAGTYLFSPGSYAGPVRAKWNYEFSINTDPSNGGLQKLDDFDFYLSANGPGFGPFTINVLTTYLDNSYGDNTTANGAGVEGLSGVFAPFNNIGQNSQNIVFAGGDLNALGLYSFSLYATALGAGSGGARVAQVDMAVLVPEPSSLALFGIGSLVFLQRIRRR